MQITRIDHSHNGIVWREQDGSLKPATDREPRAAGLQRFFLFPQAHHGHQRPVVVGNRTQGVVNVATRTLGGVAADQRLYFRREMRTQHNGQFAMVGAVVVGAVLAYRTQLAAIVAHALSLSGGEVAHHQKQCDQARDEPRLKPCGSFHRPSRKSKSKHGWVLFWVLEWACRSNQCWFARVLSQSIVCLVAS